MKNVIEYILKTLCPIDICDKWEEGDTVNCLPETEKCLKCWTNVDKKLGEAKNIKKDKLGMTNSDRKEILDYALKESTVFLNEEDNDI